MIESDRETLGTVLLGGELGDVKIEGDLALADRFLALYTAGGYVY
jgi:hypothetical protein